MIVIPYDLSLTLLLVQWQINSLIIIIVALIFLKLKLLVEIITNLFQSKAFQILCICRSEVKLDKYDCIDGPESQYFGAHREI